MELIIRPVMLKDLDEVLMIEDQSFKIPWSPSVFFLLAKNNGQVMTREGEIWMHVGEYEGNVVSYIVWEFEIRDRKVHLLNIAVRDDCRRRGIASSLFRSMLESLTISDVESCYLEVRESNTSARRFYEKMGMTSCDKIPQYYEDEDAIIYHIGL